MNELELLSRWPGWNKKSPDEILASEAWAMRARWGDDEVAIRFSDNRPRDLIALKIALDDEEHFLGIGERESFPDLVALWDRKKEIPQSLVLALVEKECGKLLQLLENSIRRQLTIIGLTDPSERAGTQGFDVVASDGTILASFALNISPMVKEAFGDISAIDTSHISIRSMTLPATVEYALFSIGADGANIASGDYILAPELANLAAAKWTVGEPADDDKYHLRSVMNYPITFSSFADSEMPEIPEPTDLVLYYGSKRIAVGRYAMLGVESAFAVEEVL